MPLDLNRVYIPAGHWRKPRMKKGLMPNLKRCFTGVRRATTETKEAAGQEEDRARRLWNVRNDIHGNC